MGEEVMHHIWGWLEDLTHSGPKLRCGEMGHMEKPQKKHFCYWKLGASGNLKRTVTQYQKLIKNRTNGKFGLGFVALFQISESQPTFQIFHRFIE